MAGQTMTDRLLAARHSLAGQGLAKSVCKATTEELIGPKKKHLDYLIHCTNEPNVSIPQLANLLIERTQNTNWVVVFKALITVHHLMCYGNERFTQYLASSNSTFQLSNFLDKSGVQGYEMSPFIRRYAKYLNEKAMSYRTVAFDFCKVKRGKEDGVLRTMNAEKLLKTLPVLQSQLDELLEFDCTAADLSNGVINMAFMLLFRDLIRLFAGYNDSIINLLEKFFEMNKKQARQALDLYKKFLIRMDRVGEFLKVAENVGIDKGEIPDLTKAPSSLLDALEQHLAALEGKKGPPGSTPSQTATQSQRSDVKSGVSALSNTSSAFGTAAAAHSIDGDEALKQAALAEEEAAINHYKSKVQSPTKGGDAAATNPFLVGSPSQPIVDLFAPAADQGAGLGASGKASDDLLQLGNPFADIFAPSGQAQPQPPVGAPGMPITQQPQAQNNIWMSNGFSGQPAVAQAHMPLVGGAPQPQAQPAAFVTDNAFVSAFPSTDPAAQQAAAGGVEENPFAGDNKAPPRPPPPRPPSPSKSALDDLSDGIKAAMGQQPQQSFPPPATGLPAQQQPFPPPYADGFPAGFPGQFQQFPPGVPGQFPQGFQDGQIPQGFPPPAGVPAPLPPGSQAFTGYPQPQAPIYGPNSSPAKVPMAAMQGGEVTASGKVLTGDLDTSLALLAENLTINKGGQAKGMQWSSPKNLAGAKNPAGVGVSGGGAAGWTPQPMQATTTPNYRPMGPGMMGNTSPFTTASPFALHAHHLHGMMGSPRQAVVAGSGVPFQAQPSQQPQPQQLDPFGAL